MSQLGNAVPPSVPQFSCVQNRSEHDRSVRMGLSLRQALFWPPSEGGQEGGRRRSQCQVACGNRFFTDDFTFMSEELQTQD